MFQVCADNLEKNDKYHVSIWGGKKWQCCRAPTRIAEGCEPCSEWNETPPNSPIIKNGDNNSPILGQYFLHSSLYIYMSILYSRGSS